MQYYIHLYLRLDSENPFRPLEVGKSEVRPSSILSLKEKNEGYHRITCCRAPLNTELNKEYKEDKKSILDDVMPIKWYNGLYERPN